MNKPFLFWYNEQNTILLLIYFKINSESYNVNRALINCFEQKEYKQQHLSKANGQVV